MDSPVVKRRNNALTDAQVTRLYKWLDESREFCSTATAQKCAVLAAAELKFGVTSSNVLSAKRALNITKPKPVVEAPACRCRDLAKAILIWTISANTEALKSRLHEIMDGKPPVAPELPLGATSPLKFEVA